MPLKRREEEIREDTELKEKINVKSTEKYVKVLHLKL